MSNDYPFNRSYFEGGAYTGIGYQDFPYHNNTIELIKKRHPQSVIDIGGARGYIVKKLNDFGIPSTCIDISEHCWHTRVTDNFILHDLTKIPYGKIIYDDKYISQTEPFKDKEFDLSISISVLEYIHEKDIDNVIREISRISRRGFHGITFYSNNHSNNEDKARINLKPKEWWISKFKEIAPDYSAEIVDKEEMETGPITIPGNTDNLVKLNIGSFVNMYHYGWSNIDIIDLSDFSKQNEYIFRQADVTKSIPYENNSVDIIVSSHFIEHITRDEGINFLKECYRVLKPNSTIRLTVPDTELLTKKYLDNTIKEYKDVNIGVENSPDNAHSLFELLLAGHKTIYDYDSISRSLTKAGFSNVKRQSFNKSESKIIETQTIDMYPTLSLYIDATKGGPIKQLTEKKAENKNWTILTAGSPPLTIHTKDLATSQIKSIKSIKSDRLLRIALISTPFFGVPPKTYGGLEQIVWDLAEALDELGHEVTIFAPEGSQSPKHGHLITTGHSVSTANVNWFEEEKKQYDVYSKIINDKDFDIIHGHGWFGFEYLLKMNNSNIKIIHTHHGGTSWDSPPFPKANIVAISNWMKTYTEQHFKQKGYDVKSKYVYNGIDLEKYIFDPNIKRTNRLLYVGRFSKFKQPDMAIQVAKRANLPIDLIGGTFVDDLNYLHQIESMCNDKDIVIHKDVPHEFKIKKLQEAKALIVPSRMSEPFGLTCIEGMACGTPVIGTRDGAIPEIIVDGETGFICDNEEQMVEAIKNIGKIDPLKCRNHIEKYYSRRTMAENYVNLYKDIIKDDNW